MTSNLTVSSQTATEDAAPEHSGFEPARRGMLGLLSKGGITLLGALAGIAATSSEASAGPSCCNLASSNRCQRGCPSNCSFCCPVGWRKRSWVCLAGTRDILCGECQQGGSTCHDGSAYACSVWIDQVAC